MRCAASWASAQSAAPSARRCGSLSPMARYSTTGARDEKPGSSRSSSKKRARKAARLRPQASRSAFTAGSGMAPSASMSRACSSASEKSPCGGSSSGRRRWKVLLGKSMLKKVASAFSNCVATGST